jgi:hypothetical protein
MSMNESMHETRNYLIKEISALSFDQFNKMPEKNKWSIAQICHHLVLVELATVKAIKWGLREKANSHIERKNIDLILDRTRKIQVPKIVEPSEEPFEIQQIIDMLNDSRKELLRTINAIEDPSVLKEKSVNHPAFGALPLDQWVELIPLHEQRHTKQIQER